MLSPGKEQEIANLVCGDCNNLFRTDEDGLQESPCHRCRVKGALDSLLGAMQEDVSQLG